ncbi:MAG: ABC transporter permease [Dehalococcoidales bacterium]
MRSYILRRLLLIIPTLFIVSLIVFTSIRLIPGSVVDYIVSSYEFQTKADLQQVRHELGLDKPMLEQYGIWMGQIIVHGNLGKSMITNEPVVQDVDARWPVTVELGILGLIIAQLIAIPIGIYSAIRQDSVGDFFARTFAIVAISVPNFFLATLVIVYPSIWWHYMASIKLIEFTKDPLGNLQMFIIPSIVLGISMAGLTMRMTRTMMLEVLRQDYIRTAWSKGLKERVVVLRHALKNALLPIITIIGSQISLLVGGSVIIENIFQLPGMGQLFINAIGQRDYTLVSSIVLLYAVAIVIINLITDLTYGMLDPRVHYN